jgi:uncharacterized damage-inducible protein DinB
MPLDTESELYEINYWARDRQFQVYTTLTPEQFLRPMGNSFPSVRETLWSTCRWWSGFGWSAGVASRRPSKKRESIRGRWNFVEAELRDFPRNLAEPELAKPLTYTNMQSQVWCPYR